MSPTLSHLCDDIGGVVHFDDFIDRNHSYTYDDLYRLKTVDYDEQLNLLNESYTYDKVGNRLSMTKGAATTNYIYDALDRLLETTGAENKIFSYTDRAEIARSDNTDTGAVRDFTWDTFSRLREVSQNGVVQAKYGYDHSGTRMVQEHTITGEVDRFIYEGSNILYELDSDRPQKTGPF